MKEYQGGVTPIRLNSHNCDRTQSTVNGQTIRMSAVNGQSGVSQHSNPSAERTRLVLQFAPNLAVGLHMRGMLISKHKGSRTWVAVQISRLLAGKISEQSKVNGQKLAWSTVKLLKRAGQSFDPWSQL